MDFVINVIPDPLNFTVSIVTTLVLFFALRHFLFSPMKEFLEKRRDYIDENLRTSEQKLLKAEKMEKDYTKKLDEAKVEAKDIVEDARKNYNRILDDAKKDATIEKERILNKAGEDAENIRKKAMDDLKDDIVDIALSAAKDLTKNELSKKGASDYTAKRIKELGELSWEK